MKSFTLRFGLLCSCLLLAGGCLFSTDKSKSGPVNSNAAPAASATADAPKEASAGAAGKADDIRRTDFKNFTYEPYCAGEDASKLTVKNGEYALEKGEYDRLFFSVTSVAYGDVDGDGGEDAIVLTNCNTGGTGQFSEGFVYGMRDGKPALLTRIAGGDRAYGGLRAARVEGGALVVERNDVGEAGGACCPEFAVTSRYKLEGGKLRQIGGDERRELYPAARVRFERGATDATVNVKLTDEDDVKRFSFGAQAGQFVTVTSSSTDVSISLVSGEAEIVKEGDYFEAKLKENGDFVIQVQKIGGKNVAAAVTIEIQ